jgi:hypothetical protein
MGVRICVSVCMGDVGGCGREEGVVYVSVCVWGAHTHRAEEKRKPSPTIRGPEP